MYYRDKYLKYKKKYLELQNQLGGLIPPKMEGGGLIPKNAVVHEHEGQYKLVPNGIAEAAIKLAKISGGMGIASPVYNESNTINVTVNYNNSTSVEYEVGRILSEAHTGGQDIIELYMINKTTTTRRKIFILKPTSEIYNSL